MQNVGHLHNCWISAIFGKLTLVSCATEGVGYGRAAMVEPGIVTLAKIVGTLLVAMGIVPFLFLLAPGDRSEPEVKDTFDGDVQ